jgi:nitroreductase
LPRVYYIDTYQYLNTSIFMHDTITKQMNWRYATKVFNPEAVVPEAALHTIIEAGRMAPTAYGLQPFSLVHIVDTTLRERIKTEVGFNQPQITDAGALFVLARRTDINDAFVDEYVARTAHTRGMDESSLEGFRSMMKGDILSRSDAEKATWAGRQAYIALGVMLQSAALLEVDACPMEGFNPKGLDEILGLGARNLASVGLLALGYRGEGDYYATAPKVRVSVSDFVVTY